jgi:large-conductance mechanosensitive channel
MRRGQSIIEYVVLFIIVSAAIMMSYKYLNRSVNAKLKNVQEEMEYKNY